MDMVPPYVSCRAVLNGARPAGADPPRSHRLVSLRNFPHTKRKGTNWQMKLWRFC